ncbi:MAG: class I SAM-dependent methyltransferase [Lachnospiraceae bacterium]|nr:methyltransferase domain-containing protein [Lachnospiraceae bacterium]MDY2956013.1 class I SAM-dependent methyltransferase [Lachnospiraceae bacterium]
MKDEERASRWADGSSYNEYILEEFSSFRKQAWKDRINKKIYFKGSGLDILDIGTGPGFFSCILSEEGHNVTGIDQSPGMLECAEENAERLNVRPKFIKADINEIDTRFPRESFDVIISRNVTWTLEHPKEVYKKMKELLRPGGIILIYDANWFKHNFDEELKKKVERLEKEHFEKYGVERKVTKADYEYYDTAPLTKEDRPNWDINVLKGMNMNVSVEYDIGRYVYEDWEKELYRESPMFEIAAIKLSSDEVQKNMKDYWNERSKTFGFPYAEMDDIRHEVAHILPREKCKVLDVGTGTGIMAAVMSSLGHEVIAVDIAENMIEKAKENLYSLNLKAEFVCTNSDELPFLDNTFDVICSRNLIWAFLDPEKVLRQWRRVLKPGGLLLYYDGNHYRYLFDEETRKNRNILIEHLGDIHGHSEEDKKKVDYSKCDETAYDLPLSKLNRPAEWDDIVLPQYNFAITQEIIRMPQSLIPYGRYKPNGGYYTNFLISAINCKED